MANTEKKVNLARTLIVLTLLLFVFQLVILGIGFYVTGVFDIARIALTSKLLYSEAVMAPLLKFMGAQLLVYAFFIYLVWFITVSVAEFFSMDAVIRQWLGVLLWFNFVVGVIVLSLYFVPHSTFTTVIRHNLFNDAVIEERLRYAMMVTLSIGGVALVVTLFCMLFNIFTMRHIIRNAFMLAFMFGALFFAQKIYMPKDVKKFASADYNLPNIFIIGFDGVRSDYLSFYDVNRRPTPHFDEFLRSSVVFEDAYTPIARTMPSWMSILTGKYPLHHNVRENNTYLGNDYDDETLPKLLQKAGYETIYATDDRRFNIIDKSVGFDHLIGPSGTVADYLISALGDFPLINLVIPTPVGKMLFPESYANHGSAQSYDPDNFLDHIDQVLRQKNDKPLFLSVHFNLSAWPYYWFNDKAVYNVNNVDAYINTIPGDDRILGRLFEILDKYNLMKRAIVVLISDHGITLAQHGDRVIKEERYQGDKAQMKVRRTRYNDVNFTKVGFQTDFVDPKVYGVDTSFGYGGDVLSLKQNRSLLAIKGFGFDIGKPHQVYGPSILLDIAPTLLDLLQLEPLRKSDGISLKPYLNSPFLELSKNRPIFLESAYSVTELEQRDFTISKVLEQSISNFFLNPKTGVVMLNPEHIKGLIENKQRAILLGDWVLAYYPSSERYKFVLDAKTNSFQVQNYMQPPYFVLVNLKTGSWATDINQPMVLNSPFAKLKQQLLQFYGHEMDTYFENESKNL